MPADAQDCASGYTVSLDKSDQLFRDCLDTIADKHVIISGLSNTALDYHALVDVVDDINKPLPYSAGSYSQNIIPILKGRRHGSPFDFNDAHSLQ